MAYDDQRKELPSTILDNTNMRLSAPNPSVKGKYASLSFKVFKGNPRLQVRTNNPDDRENYGTIAVPMTMPVFSAFIHAWESAIDAPAESKFTIECENFPKGQRQGPGVRPELMHVIHVGKDADGVVSLMVVDAKNPRRDKIKFEVTAPRFITVLEKGQPMDRARASEYFSRVWTRLLRDVVTQEAVRTWEKPAQYNPQGGGNGGYQRGGGGGYQRGGDQGGRGNDYQSRGGDQGGRDDYSSSGSQGGADVSGDDIPF